MQAKLSLLRPCAGFPGRTATALRRSSHRIWRSTRSSQRTAKRWALRHQVVQAEAAGIAPDVRMNPILLKPTSDVGSQVIIMGEAQGNRTARGVLGPQKGAFAHDQGRI